MAAEQSCRQYANEALRSASESKSEEEKQALIDLARTWNQMALELGSSPAEPTGWQPHRRDRANRKGGAEAA
jgi:hypothetical protein